MTSPERAFSLPVGTVTFLLTDVEGSTAMWSGEPVEAMRAAIIRHYAIVCEAIDDNGGVRPVEQGEGDSVVGAFARPTDAVRAAVAAQFALGTEPWPTATPIRVRMAIHTGEAQLRDDHNYAGQAIARTARLRALARGGHILVSGATRDLATDQAADEFAFRHVGEQRLRDLARAENVWQVIDPRLSADILTLPQADATPHTLPVPLTPFIGRLAEVETLAALVERERLVVATGAGGAGKTRLAREVGADLLDAFPAGVWWAELAPLESGAVEAEIRRLFDIGEGSPIALEEAVNRRVNGRPCLLILDNCEHVSAVVGPLAERLLRVCPTLHVLATSRGMLDVPGELAWRIPPLSLPSRQAPVAVEALSQFDAVRVFCDRARRARPNFELNDDNGPSVAEICHRLDGIPLAIELAAARCRVLSPAQILAGLHDAFRLLTGGALTLMPRQQTLEASITWSHDLLNDAERLLLRRLSVFVDGWTLEAAEAVAGTGVLDTLAILDILDRLVTHSLVSAEDGPVGTRFRMLETVRQFAARQLDAADEIAEMRSRHSRYFAGWLRSLRDALSGNHAVEYVEILAADRGNLRAAVLHLLTFDQLDEGCDLVESLFRVTTQRAWMAVAVDIAHALAQRQPDLSPTQQVVHWWAQSNIALNTLDFPVMYTTSEEGADAAARVGDIESEAVLRVRQLLVLRYRGVLVLDEALRVAERLPQSGEPYRALQTWMLLMSLASGTSDVDAITATIVQCELRAKHPEVGPRIDVAKGALAILECRPHDAVRFLTSPDPVGNQAIDRASWLIIAAGDAGIDCDEVVLALADDVWRVDGSPLAGSAVFGVRAARALWNGDVLAASSACDEATRLLTSVGISSSWVGEQVALIAAGVSDLVLQPGEESSLWKAATAYRGLGELGLREGRLNDALREARRGAEFAAEHRLQRELLYAVELVGRALMAGGRAAEATRVFGAADVFRSERNARQYPILQRLLDESRESAREALGEDAFDELFAEGRTLSLEQAVDYVSRLRADQVTDKVGWNSLTPMERKVADLVATGLTNLEVGKQLLMSPETVKTHLSKVFGKLGVTNRQQLAVAHTRRHTASAGGC